MVFWRPRSLLQLLLGGFFTALAPLGIAILFTVQTLNELAESDEATTLLVVEVTRLGNGIQRDLLELERRAGQYLALGDPELAQLFEREKDRLIEDLLLLNRRMPSSSTDISVLVLSLDGFDLPTAKFLETGIDSPELINKERLEQAFLGIGERGEAVQVWLKTGVDKLLEDSAAKADELISRLNLQLVLVAFATLGVLSLFAYWINRPVKALTQEIHRLGTTGLSHTIEISGPSEIRDLGRKLEWLRSQLHETEQQKQQFLRHISHELKTPLSSLREGGDLLAEHVTGHLSRQQQEIVEIVQRNSIELQRLIENLIDYNQVPREQLCWEKVCLAALMHEVLTHYRMSIDNKGLQLSLNDGLEEWVVDRYKLRTSMDNLLSNAVNYTPSGGSIVVAWQAEGANLIIDVANSGEPIPAEDRERVFEPFFQSLSKRSGPIKGSGIGLSVARDCIEVQGGSLTLVAHEALPVCFRLTCPAH
jgi:two-component system, NtrC family, sensor histidine kinase GlrK